jgi:hypothetical protein
MGRGATLDSDAFDGNLFFKVKGFELRGKGGKGIPYLGNFSFKAIELEVVPNDVVDEFALDKHTLADSVGRYYLRVESEKTTLFSVSRAQFDFPNTQLVIFEEEDGDDGLLCALLGVQTKEPLPFFAAANDAVMIFRHGILVYIVYSEVFVGHGVDFESRLSQVNQLLVLELDFNEDGLDMQ